MARLHPAPLGLAIPLTLLCLAVVMASGDEIAKVLAAVESRFVGLEQAVNNSTAACTQVVSMLEDYKRTSDEHIRWTKTMFDN
eukprot:9872197-Lingulodinium_polyedra.AAC.1